MSTPITNIRIMDKSNPQQKIDNQQVAVKIGGKAVKRH